MIKFIIQIAVLIILETLVLILSPLLIFYGGIKYVIVAGVFTFDIVFDTNHHYKFFKK